MIKKKTKIVLALTFLIGLTAAYYYLTSFKRKIYQIELGETIDNVHIKLGEPWEHKANGNWQRLSYIPENKVKFTKEFPFIRVEKWLGNLYRIHFRDSKVVEILRVSKTETLNIKTNEKTYSKSNPKRQKSTEPKGLKIIN